jgi:hypothetical protein
LTVNLDTFQLEIDSIEDKVPNGPPLDIQLADDPGRAWVQLKAKVNLGDLEWEGSVVA